MTEPSPDAIPTPEPETVAPAETCEMSPETAPTDPVAALKAEVEKWKDSALRSMAELDNFRKRSAREAQETRAYANTDLLRGILPIIDNFEMGLEAARAESEKSMIFMGMSMVQRQIADFLRDMGVTEVEAGPGKAFDPHLHDADRKSVV
jgi:molecular chaperone GrpE